VNQYPIRTLSELTGIPTTTLRAWERRYGLLKPQRTPKGHRLYSNEDIELIKRVSALLKNNHTISEAIRIIRSPQQDPAESGSLDHWAGYQQQMLRSIESFNEQNLDRVYNEALAIYPIDLVTRHVVIPVLKTLGQRWRERDAGIAEEHFFSAYLRNKLGARFHHEAHRSRGRQLLVCCLPGEYHELGVMLYSIAAIGRGYQVLYLGTDTPPQQLPLVVSRTRVSAILLSGSPTLNWSDPLEQALRQCIESVDIPVLFGGEFSETYAQRLDQLGGASLGSDHSTALDRMERIIPAFSA
jgi:DNA-binding transcriptional MerR regulator